jgi:hypothetical protein
MLPLFYFLLGPKLPFLPMHKPTNRRIVFSLLSVAQAEKTHTPMPIRTIEKSPD